jgi:hypothetical protein
MKELTAEAADRTEALTAKVKLMDDLDVINGEKIEALEAKLAKAVEAASPLLNMDVWTESAEDDEMVIVSVGTVRRIRATLAEIEGSDAP